MTRVLSAINVDDHYESFLAKILLCAFSLHIYSSLSLLYFFFDKNQTANRFLPASNPYNPYYTGTLLPTTIIGPEHAATALASTPIPQSMSLAAASNTMSIHNAAQPQKRTDRVQVILFKLLFLSFLLSLIFVPYHVLLFPSYPPPNFCIVHTNYTHKFIAYITHFQSNIVKMSNA